MSRGGRGGGFGRGGGGGGPQSGAMQLVSFDLLKDLGSGNLFNVNTALFPEMDVPIPRKPTSNEIQQWKLRKEYLNMIKDSPYHLTAPPPPPDIERYSDKYKVIAEKRSLRDIETNLDFFPEELQAVIDPKRGKKKQKSRAVVDEYGQIEALLNAESKEGEEEEEDGEKKDDEDAENEEEYEDEEELVDDNDYAENYFDNGEGDDDDDGDNEDAYS
ncbi:DNA-directed RNA polymerase III, subunit Rpc31 [Mucor lusitanicus]|uniref:DNA-directed RNA polymerase III subunit n=1 Tax=Mucor circinelloides f. lusitanicus TaxID=29924 RepID=A0A8H4F577_MUCCL|nr:DNA-directed RNA polymerase III, subunit Rpc31 [Mucor lusitanicus]